MLKSTMSDNRILQPSAITIVPSVAESFFACMKREELSHNYYDCLEDLRHGVSNYIDFFNNMRPHQRLGMQTPAGVEAQFMAEKN